MFQIMKTKVWILLLFLLLMGCQKEHTNAVVDPPKTYTYLVGDGETKFFSATTLAFLASLAEADLSEYTYTDVRGIKIVYNTTDENDETIQASGMLLIPSGFEGNGPMISYQHGTISDDNDAPTNSSTGPNKLSFTALFSGLGAMVALPDYVGFGQSNTSNHPYLHKDLTAQSTYDFLLAIDEYMDREKIKTNGELYLTGYSQGGHATMALHQKIEKENKFQVTHSIPGAGAYDLTLLTEEILSKDEELPFMAGYVWALGVYNRLYPALQKPLTYYFNEPYAGRLAAIEKIHAAIGPPTIHRNPQKLFTPMVIDDFLNGKNPILAEVLDQNSVHDWSPKAPITLFHGTADDYVFPTNAQSAFETLRLRGGTVKYVRLEGLGHLEAVGPYLLGVVDIIFD